MPQLLLELFSEEIPARMQKRAEEDLAKLLGEKLGAHGLKPEAIATFSSPRRLGAVIENLPAKAADVNEEKKGPRVGAPEQAMQGFLKSAGLASIDQAEIVQDKKGDFYVARIQRAGRDTPAILGEIIPEIIRAFPWPKSMRSGSSDLTWVRPLHNILCLFDGAPVQVRVESVGNEAKTWGHRFHAPGAIAVKDAGDHYAKLRDAKVMIDREERRGIILEQARKICGERKLELVEDSGLLEEVTGLVEWPVVLMGRMDEAFLDLPGEVIRLTMRTHQKYFAVRNPQNGKLAPHFITVANIEAKDGGDAIAAGNARVLSARLNDARFFWDGDKKTPLYTEERKAKLEKIVFHQKLGSVWDKVERVKALAVELCAVTGADVELVKRAAELCKMDLVTETVGEFPELQGQIGRQLYALEKGANESVAAAIEDHYRPLGPNDRVPSDKVAVTLALADKLDTLVGFWAIRERPTGSGDPYALRRSALGLINAVLANNIRLRWIAVVAAHELTRRQSFIAKALLAGQMPLAGIPPKSGLDLSWRRQLLEHEIAFDPEDGSAVWTLARQAAESVLEAESIWFHDAIAEPHFLGEPPDDVEWVKLTLKGKPIIGKGEDVDVGPLDYLSDLLAFLADRLKVQLRDQGKRHDLVDAVFALGDDDLVRIVARVEALDAFLKTEDGANLLAGYKRAANIIAAEEKKGRLSAADLEGAIKVGPEPQEKALAVALDAAIPQARTAVEKEDFASAMKALAGLRAPVDAFFEKVLVNADDADLRLSRLRLLARLRTALGEVADFSKIEG